MSPSPSDTATPDAAAGSRQGAGRLGVLRLHERPWYRHYVLGVLLLAYIFSFIDRQILSLLVGPIRRELGISDFEMSLLQGWAFALFYSVMALPIARLADRYDRLMGPCDAGLLASMMHLWTPLTSRRARHRLFVLAEADWRCGRAHQSGARRDQRSPVSTSGPTPQAVHSEMVRTV